MQTGEFTDADTTYFAAPQQLNNAGQVIGHNHVVIEQIPSLDSTQPTNPRTFAFFKGLNGVAVKGQLTADVTNGLPAGTYRISSITTAANHQGVIVPVAQRGSVDDAIYVRSFLFHSPRPVLTSKRTSSLPSVVMATITMAAAAATTTPPPRTTTTATITTPPPQMATTTVTTPPRPTMVKTVRIQLVTKIRTRSTARMVTRRAGAMSDVTRGAFSHGTNLLEISLAGRPPLVILSDRFLTV
jgi:hypothetical protein